MNCDPRLLLVTLLISPLSVCAVMAQVSPDSVTAIALPPGDAMSTSYRVSVNGVRVPVAASRDASYARFAFTGTARVTVTCAAAITSYRLSPETAGIPAVVSGSALEFALDRPRKLILHHVDGITEKLCLLAEAPETEPVRSGDPGVVTLTGVDASGATDVTAAVQQAIDALLPGGTLLIPRGVYGFTTLRLKAATTVYLAMGAMLKATGSSQGQVVLGGAHGAALRGQGVIDGDGDRHRAAVGGNENLCRPLLAVAAGQTTTGVTIDGLVLRNPPAWTAILFDTVDWRIQNLAIVCNDLYPNRDGIDPHNAEGLVLDDCLFLTSDDCIAYSTTRTNVNLRTVIKNSVMYNSNSGACVRIGPWIGDGTRNVTFENLDLIQGCELAGNEAALAIYAGGDLSDVRYRAIRAEDPRWRLATMVTSWIDFYAGAQSGSVTNVLFEDLSCREQGYLLFNPGALGATPPIQNLAFTGFVYRGQTVSNPAGCDWSANGTPPSAVSFAPTAAPTVSLAMTSPAVSWPSAAKLVVSINAPAATATLVPLTVRSAGTSGTHFQTVPASVTIPAGLTAVRTVIRPLLPSYAGDRLAVVVEAEHSGARAYLLSQSYRAMTTLVSHQ
jgi:hypothetical protein